MNFGNPPTEVTVSGVLTNAELRATPVQVAVVSGGGGSSGGLTDEQLRAAPVPVSGPLTDAQARAAPLPVSLATAPTTPVTGTFWPATQAVSGTVAVSNLPATQPVSGTVAVSGSVAVTGPLTDAALRASAVPVSLATAPTTPVTGTFWQATQPVSGPLTDTQLRATPVPVSGTVTASGPLTDTQLRAQAVPVSAAVSNFPATQAVSIAAVVSSTLGNSTGKTLAMKTGTLPTTATTADQVVLTYTVTSGKTFFLQYLNIQCRLTTFAATATLFGTASLESPAGTKLITRQIIGTGAYDATQEFAEPLPFAAGTVIRVVCTPATITSFTWQASFGGFER